VQPTLNLIRDGVTVRHLEPQVMDLARDVVYMDFRWRDPDEGYRVTERVLGIRRVDGALIGFIANLSLEAVTPEDAAADPAIALVIRYAERHGPLRPGELFRYGRFWMDADRHQAITQVFTVVAAICSQSWIGPNVAWSFVAMADPDLMEPMLTEIQMRWLLEADFETGGQRYGVFGHDWRVEPARTWLRLKAERALRVEAAVPARNTSVDV